MSSYGRGGRGESNEKLALQRLHSNSHQTTFIGAWLLAGFAILTIVLSMFLMIGVWNENSDKSDAFKTYCYTIWGILAGGLILVIAFLIYFHWNMTNLWKKGKANIELAFSRDPYGDVTREREKDRKELEQQKKQLQMREMEAASRARISQQTAAAQQAADPRAVDPRAADPRAADPRAVDRRMAPSRPMV